MKPIDVSASSYVAAPPAVVYGIIADYRDGHPQILPKQYFRDLRVEAGGIGAGTRIRFTMTGMGTQEAEAVVDEPAPGRVLREHYPANGADTTFTVDPEHAGSLVTIQTVWTPRGARGLVERLFAPRFLRKAFRAELQLLRQVAEARAAVPSPS